MATRNGTANLLKQNRAYRELSEDYSPDMAACLTTRNLLRNGVDVSDKEVAGWAKINQASCKGQLDIRGEVRRAEGKAAIAAGTAVKHAATGKKSEHHN